MKRPVWKYIVNVIIGMTFPMACYLTYFILAGTIYMIELTEDGTDYQGFAVASNRILFGGGSDRVLTLTVLYGKKTILYTFGKQNNIILTYILKMKS